MSILDYILVSIAPIIRILVAIAVFRDRKSRKQFLTFIVLAMFIFGAFFGFFHFYTENPATITAGNDYVQISSSQTGTMNVTSSKIASAYVPR